MFLCSFLLCCLGNVFFLAGAGMKMRQTLQPKFGWEYTPNVQVDIHKRLKFSHLLSPLWGHIEILEERKRFREIRKYQLNDINKYTDWQVLRLQVNPASTIKKSTRSGLDMAKTYLNNGQQKQVGGRTKQMVTKKGNPKKDASRAKYNGSKTKRQIQLQHLGGTRVKQTVSKCKQLQVTFIQREPQLMLEREENDVYKEVKCKNSELRSNEFFTNSRINRQLKGERKVVLWKVKPTNGGIERIGLLSGSLKNRGYPELHPMIDGEVITNEVTSTKNRFRDVDFYNIVARNLHLHHKGDKKEIPKQVTLTQDESREDSPLDPGTNKELKIFLRRKENVMSKEFNPTNNGPEEIGFSLGPTTNIQFNSLPNRDEEEIPMEVVPAKSGSSRNELYLDTTTNRQRTIRWTDAVVVPTKSIQISKYIFSNTLEKTQLESQLEKGGTENHIGDHQKHLQFPSDTFLQPEGSGSSELKQKLNHENKISLAGNIASSQYTSITGQTNHIFNLQLPLTTPKQSSDNALPSPTNKKDMESPRVTDTTLSEGLHDSLLSPLVTDTALSEGPHDSLLSPRVTDTTLSEGLHDSLLSPLEVTMNHDSGSAYCKPGYKEHGGVCRSLCDIDGIYCENGGQCVIVENTGAMCRCRQTNYLCYSGRECCRSSLTTTQLTCVIGSCCILLSVLLGCLSVLIRRMDVKAVSKSVRTRLWISSLMPDSSSSSSSHSESDFTVSSDYDCPPDLSSFHCTKEVREVSSR